MADCELRELHMELDGGRKSNAVGYRPIVGLLYIVLIIREDPNDEMAVASQLLRRRTSPFHVVGAGAP